MVLLLMSLVRMMVLMLDSLVSETVHQMAVVSVVSMDYESFH